MGLKVGTNEVSKIFFGSSVVGRVYRGNNMVWERVFPTPEVPIGIAFSNIENESLTVSWNSAANATYYDINFRKQGDAWTSYTNETGLTKTFSGLELGSTYEFQIKSGNPSGTSAYSTIYNETTTSTVVLTYDFSSTIAPWTSYTGGSLSLSSGTLRLISNTMGSAFMKLPDVFVSGTQYRIDLDLTLAQADVLVFHTKIPSSGADQTWNNTGAKTFTFTAGSNPSLYIGMLDAYYSDCGIDNVVITEL